VRSLQDRIAFIINIYRHNKFLVEDIIQLCLSVAIHVHLEDSMLNGRQVWIYRYNSDNKKAGATLYDKNCQQLVTGGWLSPFSSINKTDRYDISHILLKVALDIIRTHNFRGDRH
jgi:hypothetical protein